LNPPSFLITVDGTEHEVSTGTVHHLLDTSARFWLDLASMDKPTADRLLLDTFGFHPLAVQDAEHFGQRPKVDPYDDFTLIVVYGAAGSGQLVEVHCF
jgi:Mg2+ and Co2+ transporter CorA